MPGSLAIDAGSSALAVDANGTPLTTDQRGKPRLVGGSVDLGAFESQGFTISATSGGNQSATVGTNFANPLTVAVTANNAAEPVNGGAVTFTPPSSGASATLPALNATISGGSATVTAAADSQAGSYLVTAGVSGASTSVSFTLTNNPGAAHTLAPHLRRWPAEGCRQHRVSRSAHRHRDRRQWQPGSQCHRHVRRSQQRCRCHIPQR